ncbi:hypothetical protein D3C76_1086280 [compost metagenome]
MGQDRLDFRTEQQPLLVAGVVQRLDPQTVTYQQEVAVAPVEHGEGKHPGQVLAAVLAPLQVGAQHHFGIAAGVELMACLAQALTQFVVVVDLAGIDQGDFLAAGTAVGHRLRAAAEVDDRQPSMAQQGIAVLPAATGVRPAQGQGVGHGANSLAGLGQIAGVVHPACDSAHALLLTPEVDGLAAGRSRPAGVWRCPAAAARCRASP